MPTLDTTRTGDSALPGQPAEPSSVEERLRWYAEVAGWAPSKHNSQPWRFLVRDGGIEVWPDPGRALVDTDPHQRELLIACGAATQLIAVAARAQGRRPSTDVLPDGRGGCLSRTVEDGQCLVTEQDRRLLQAARQRRTDRGPLDASSLTPALPFQLQTAAAGHGAVLRLVMRPGEQAALADVVGRADRSAARSGRDRAELLPWLREPGDLRPDGVPTDHARGPRASHAAPYVQRDFSSDTSVPGQDRAGPDDPLVAVLCTARDTALDWVAAGRALTSVLLTAQLEGAHASYLDQPVEMPTFRVLLQDQLDLPGVAQLVLRIGLGGPVGPTSRRSQLDVVAVDP